MSFFPTNPSRFLLGLAAGFGLTLVVLVENGCSADNPLRSACQRQAQCAEDEGWQFSQSECEQEAEFAFERIKSAACTAELDVYTDCTDALSLECHEDEATSGAIECDSEAEDLAKCMQDASEDEAKEKSGSSSGGKSSSGGSSSGGKSSSSSGGKGSGGLAEYCDMVAECGAGLSADQCKSQQGAVISAAEKIGCDDELEAMFGCAAELSCTDLAQYTSKCKAEYDAYTACGTGN